MTKKNFIKDNPVLIVGLILPVLLIVLFFLATVLPKSLASPPQHEMLFSYVRYDYQTQPLANVEFFVKDGVLKVRIAKNDRKNPNYGAKRLMAYDAKTESVREIPYDLQALVNEADNAEVTLAETKNLNLNPSTTSPDGYSFEGPNYGHGGLVTELFGGGYRNQGYRIKKGSVGYKIPALQNDYYFNSIQFIGWVVAKP